jgi:hypothetical protein
VVAVRTAVIRITSGTVLKFRKIVSLRLGDGDPAHFHIASFSGVSSRLVMVSWRCMARTNGKAVTASPSTTAWIKLWGKAGM